MTESSMPTTTPHGLYSARLAARLAKIKPQHFQAWAKANLLRGRRVRTGGRYETVYSYEDLLLIRLIKRLKEQGAKPREIRAALDTITKVADGDPHAWMKVVMYVMPGFIAVVLPDRPDWNPLAASKGPQKMALVFFPDLIKELERELVPPEYASYVEISPDILGGAPVVRGTRVSTRAVSEAIESGATPRELYPSLSDEQVETARRYEEFLAAA